MKFKNATRVLGMPFWVQRYYIPAELDVYIGFSPKFESAERSISINAKFIAAGSIKPFETIVYWRLGSPESKKQEEAELAEKAMLLLEKDYVFLPVLVVLIGPIVCLCCIRQRRIDKEQNELELLELKKQI
jgi:hypothetical protein